MMRSGNRGAKVWGVMIASSVAFAALVSRSSTAGATTITVNGSCSLPQAITAVNTKHATGGCAAGTGGDTIVIASSAITTLSSTQTITRSVTIRSSVVKSRTRIQTASGASPSAMFTISPLAGTAASVTFQDVYMWDPNQNTTAVRAVGRNSSDKLTLTRCLIDSFGTTAVFATEMSVAVSDSYLVNNSGGVGGAIRIEGSGRNTVLTLANSSFERNGASSSGGAIFGNGAANSTIQNCTFNQNSATYGGALVLDGPGTYSIIGSTIANNTAVLQGGGGTGTAIINFTLTLLAANYLDPDPNLVSDWDFNSTINVLNDSLLSSSFSYDGFGNHGGIPINSLGANSLLDYDAAFGAIVNSDSFNLGGDMFDAPPTLGLNPAGPAVDAIPSNVTSLTTDQRGCARGIDTPNSLFSNKFDIGAVEYDPNVQAETLFATSTVNGTLSTVTGISGFQPSTGAGIKFVPGSSGASSVSFHLPMANGGGATSLVLHIQSCPTCGTYQISMGDDLLTPVQFISLGNQSFSSSTTKVVTLPARSLAPFEPDGSLGEDDVLDIKFTLVSKPANSNGQMVLDFITLQR